MSDQPTRRPLLDSDRTKAVVLGLVLLVVSRAVGHWTGTPLWGPETDAQITSTLLGFWVLGDAIRKTYPPASG